MKYDVTQVTLTSGSWISLCAFEIISIPDVSVTAYATEDDTKSAYASDAVRALSSIADIQRTYSEHSNEVAVELLWYAEPTRYQTYDAKIRLFVLLRGRADNEKQSKQMLEHAAEAISILLETDRYTFSEIPYPNIEAIFKACSQSLENKQAIVRTVRQENLPLIQQCMHFDCFDFNAPALEILVNALTKAPYTFVSFQLMPIQYTREEAQLISSNCQALGTLSAGLHDQTFGVIPVVAAQRCIDTYSYYYSQSTRAKFAFNAAVYGPNATSGLVVFAVQSVLSGAGHTALSTYPLNNIATNDIVGKYANSPWALAYFLQKRYPAAVSLKEYNRLPYLVTAEEAVALFSLPIGGKKISAGFSVDYSVKDGREYRADLIDSGELTVGFLKATGCRHSLGIKKNDLAKHMLIVGTPGSGKTTFSVGLLDRLWKQKVPFLVIEPAKNEYRALISSIPELQVFTPGKNSISPFVFNPFVPPENVRLESYKPTLKTAFAAGVSMTTPLDKIFEETINNCYADFDWLDTYTASDQGKIFNISDFIKSFQKTFDAIGYTGEVGNIGKAGVVRLKGLTNLFDNYFSIPISDLLSKPTVIELAAIENADEKALIIALLLLSILSYVNANYTGDSGLRNVILLEEAHVLLDSRSNVAQGDADPSSIAQGLLKRMLAELRSYGLGLIIADQSPRKVSADVVALTDVKLAFRLVESADKQIIADSSNMSEQQVARLSRLRPGEAFFFFNKLEEPEELLTENYRLENHIEISLSDAALSSLSTYWKSRQHLLRPFPECKSSRYCSSACDYHRRILAKEIARRIFIEHILPAKPYSSKQTKPGGYSKQDVVAAQYNAMKGVLYDARFEELTKEYSHGETVTPELLACVQVHLIRRIQYETSIPLSSAMINGTISNS